EIEGGDTLKLAKWWETFQNAGREMRQAMAADLDGQAPKSGQRRRKTFRKKKSKPKS
ncbi:polynucleotide adenylyltransferase PcnB, partial [Vibrio parahaemolyticus]